WLVVEPSRRHDGEECFEIAENRDRAIVSSEDEIQGEVADLPVLLVRKKRVLERKRWGNRYGTIGAGVPRLYDQRRPSEGVLPFPLDRCGQGDAPIRKGGVELCTSRDETRHAVRVERCAGHRGRV